MRRHAKASTQRQAKGLGRIFRGVLATRNASLTSRGSGAPSFRRLAIPVAVFLALLIIASSASASKIHLFSSSFGAAGSGSGQFSANQGIAVDQSDGSVYVVDSGNFRVQKFNSAGSFILTFGKGVNQTTSGDVCTAASGNTCGAGTQGSGGSGFDTNGGFSNPTFVAIDPNNGDVYVADSGTNVVDKFNSAGDFLSSNDGSGSGGSFGSLAGIAADSSRNLWVYDTGAQMREFDDTGAFITQWNSGYGVTAAGIAVDSSTNLYAVRGFPAVEKFNSTGSDLGEVDGSGTATSVAIDPATDDLYVGAGSEVNHFVGGCAAPCSPIESFGSGDIANAAGVAVRGSSATAYVSDPGKPAVEIFNTIIAPGVSANAATGITPTKATLNGSVNPDNLAVSECKFEYGADTSYGSSKPCEGAIPTDGSDHPVSGALTGLTPNTTYHFRIVATNANGTNQSADQSFTTANPVVTNPATGVLGTKATLNGAVFPEGEAVSECKFEYGTDTSYGSSKPCEGAIPTDENEHLVTASLTHLAPNGTTYHFRIVAVGGSGAVQGTDETFTTADTVITSPATAITGIAATFNGTLNPEEIPYTECKFEYGTDTSYGSTAPCAESPGAIGTGTSPVAVHADVGGLSLGTIYHFRLVGTNADGTAKGGDQSFKTLGPVIKAEWAESAIFTEATLKAEINPEGQATTFHIEYGTDTSYGHSTAEGGVGSDSADHTVTSFLEGLTPGTTYHWRVVATNSSGSNQGPDRTFTTYATPVLDTNCPNQQFRSGPSAALPDCRAYEMVSPVDKAGGDVTPPIGAGNVEYLLSLDQSSTSGQKFTYGSYRAFGDSVGSPYTNQFMASRGADGWANHAITPARGPAVPTLAQITAEFKAFSPDLSTAWVWHSADPPIAPGAPEGFINLYRRDNVGESYAAVTTAKPPHSVSNRYIPEFQGASSDGSHAIFTATDALTSEAPYLGANPSELYEWFAGQLRLVSILPNGEPSLENSSAGTQNDVLSLGASQSLDHAISDDGSRIFWTASPSYGYGPGKIYVRIDGQTTVPVSESISEAPARFFTASADGSKAIFGANLNLDGIGDLYEFDVDTETPTLIAHKVSGLLGASDDVSYVYFVSRENLDAGATEGQPNVYLYHEGDLSFIATLTAYESGAGYGFSTNPVQTEPFKHLARVTPDGRHLAFPSNRSLTDYDNTDAATGEAAAEVYVYDADSGQLTCASCNPSGAWPVAKNFNLLKKPNFFEGEGYFAAAVIRGWKSELYDGRNLSDDGKRLFFESYGALVPQDTNGAVDVYEWEAQGAGSCQKAGGCVSLISTGKSTADSEFVDASASGDDVFIRTLSGIDPHDPGLLDIYDARAGGGFPYTPPPDACVGDACQSPPEPPNDPTPASAGFRGAGNPVPRKARRNCAARKRHAKGKRQAKSKQHTKRCKRTNRRAGR